MAIGSKNIEFCAGTVDAKGESTSVSFEKRFSSRPIVTCSIAGSNKGVFAENITVDGFDVILTDDGFDIDEGFDIVQFTVHFQAINVIR